MILNLTFIVFFRSYFKTVDKYRSESASAVPRMRLRLDEEFQDSVSRGSSLSERLKNFQIKNSFSLIAGLSQFEPGKINKKLTSKFENDSEQSIRIINLSHYNNSFR